MICRFYCVMDIASRSGQQDCILMGQRAFQEDALEVARETEDVNFLIAVCDGMGGHAAGDKASFFVCTRLKELLDFSELSSSRLDEILEMIQEEAAETLPEGSGTTLAAIAVKGREMIVFNAGDSRVYQVTKAGVHVISHDHSHVQDLVDKGLISREAAFSHQLRHVVTFGIGSAFCKVREKQRVHYHEKRIRTGECFLICSDGVSDTLRDEEIHAALLKENGFSGKKLMETLRRKGLSDNTSFVIVQFLEP